MLKALSGLFFVRKALNMPQVTVVPDVLSVEWLKHNEVLWLWEGVQRYDLGLITMMFLEDRCLQRESE